MRKPMKKKDIRSVWGSWATLVDIAPYADYKVYVTYSSDADALRSDVERVSSYLKKARGIYDGEWVSSAKDVNEGERVIDNGCRA